MLNITGMTFGGANSADFSQYEYAAHFGRRRGCMRDRYVTFTPSATGSRAASITIGDNASDSPQTIARAALAPCPAWFSEAQRLTFGKLAGGIYFGGAVGDVDQQRRSSVNITAPPRQLEERAAETSPRPARLRELPIVPACMRDQCDLHDPASWYSGGFHHNWRQRHR